MSERVKIAVTGATGNVGTFAALFLARLGVADDLYVVARNPHKISDVFYNSQTNSILCGNDTMFHAVTVNIEDEQEVARVFGEMQPAIILNCAAGLSLYPFFPALRKRQKTRGIIPGFAHTLPKDLMLLYPLMKGLRRSCEKTAVVNLVSPDMSSYILAPLGLSPDVGAGTLDSTVQGVKMKIAAARALPPSQVDVRMAAHHALRRFPAKDVPFAMQIFAEGRDVTAEYSREEMFALIDFATDTTGVETEDSPVTSNSAVTAASGVQTVHTILKNAGIVRHGSGLGGTSGAMPLRFWRDRIEAVPPNGMTLRQTAEINDAGMVMDGLDRVGPDGTVYFTEKEQEWIRDGLGLSWGGTMNIGEAGRMCAELTAAYQRMKHEEEA